jgi:hypothetical protein
VLKGEIKALAAMGDGVFVFIDMEITHDRDAL